MEYAAQMEQERRNEELVKQYVEIINKGGFGELNQVLSLDYAIYSPSGYNKPSSREKLIENYENAGKSFTKFIWKIEDLITAKNKVICRITISGVFNGKISESNTVEKDFKFSMISIMRIENGKIVEEWQEDDQLGFARQLGMQLKPGEEGI